MPYKQYSSVEIVESISAKPARPTDEGEEQVRWAIKSKNVKTKKSGWMSFFGSPDQDATPLKDVEEGGSYKFTYYFKNNFRNLIGIEAADIDVNAEMGGGSDGRQDLIMYQSCQKAAGAAFSFDMDIDTDKIADAITDVADSLFMALTGRRFNPLGGAKKKDYQYDVPEEEKGYPDDAQGSDDELDEVPF